MSFEDATSKVHEATHSGLDDTELHSPPVELIFLPKRLVVDHAGPIATASSREKSLTMETLCAGDHPQLSLVPAKVGELAELEVW
jgi:hypothetical protein